jgi:putative alpha-1,2-mannosidase
VVHVTGGVTFTVEAQGNAPDKVFVSRVSLDGNALAGNVIDHAAIVKGGTLRFEMASAANLGGKAGNST